MIFAESAALSSQVVQDIVVLTIATIGTFVVYRLNKASKLPSNTIKNLQESNDSLITLAATAKKEMAELKEEVHRNNRAHIQEVLLLNKEISSLTGELKVWRELPIKSLSESMISLDLGQQEIIKVLKSSAITLFKDEAAKATHVAEVAEDLAAA